MNVVLVDTDQKVAMMKNKKKSIKNKIQSKLEQ